MSATLPFEKRKKLIKAWDRRISSIETPPYPRLTMISNSDVLSRNVSCRQLDPIQVFGIEENLEAIADEAVNKLKFGGCGAIIVNTVQRAQDLYVLMKERITIETELIIFHARYPSDIRLKKESLILKKFGNPSTAQERPKNALLIATQVVEQSLDIDFDFMISDLAPVDLLLQRAGRLHRHQRVREKNHQSPCILIAGLIKERLPEIAETHWGYVYDPLILYRTWAFISRECVWNLPNDIDRLVQLVYGQIDFPEEITEAIKEHIKKSKKKSEDKDKKQRILAHAVSINSDDEFENAYTDKPRGNEEGEDLGIRLETRLGIKGIAAVPIFTSDKGWRLAPSHQPFDSQSSIDDDLAKDIYIKQVKLSRGDIIDHLCKEIPKCFANHPLLKHLRPLILKEDGCEIGKTKVRLDDELGITYEAIGKTKNKESK